MWYAIYMTVETKTVSVTNVPVALLLRLKPYAVQKGYPNSDAGILRFAAVELDSRMAIPLTEEVNVDPESSRNGCD
jgi:hypothetical protein